jgi:hypothetical protein
MGDSNQKGEMPFSTDMLPRLGRASLIRMRS